MDKNISMARELIIAHIASIPSRVESLRQCVQAIYPQVDKVYVMLNGYSEVPSFLRELPKVQAEVLDNSLGDSAKFLHVSDDDGWCVVLDDDLVPNRNYVEYLKRGWEKHGGAVSLHGRTYKYPVGRFRKSYTANYRCLGSVESDTGVNLIGTGCLFFDNHEIQLDLSVFEHKFMADVLFSRFCYTRGIPMTVLKHRAGQFLRYVKPETTIWSMTGHDEIQTQIINNYLCPSAS